MADLPRRKLGMFRRHIVQEGCVKAATLFWRSIFFYTSESYFSKRPLTTISPLLNFAVTRQPDRFCTTKMFSTCVVHRLTPACFPPPLLAMFIRMLHYGVRRIHLNCLSLYMSVPLFSFVMQTAEVIADVGTKMVLDGPWYFRQTHCQTICH